MRVTRLGCRNLQPDRGHLLRFSGCLSKIQFRFLHMRTDDRVYCVHLRYLHSIVILPVNEDTITLTNMQCFVNS